MEGQTPIRDVPPTEEVADIEKTYKAWSGQHRGTVNGSTIIGLEHKIDRGQIYRTR